MYIQRQCTFDACMQVGADGCAASAAIGGRAVLCGLVPHCGGRHQLHRMVHGYRAGTIILPVLCILVIILHLFILNQTRRIKCLTLT